MLGSPPTLARYEDATQVAGRACGDPRASCEIAFRLRRYQRRPAIDRLVVAMLSLNCMPEK